MSFHNNPFIRGYRGLNVQRVLEIIVDETSPAIYRPLHPSQAHLADPEVAQQPCIFCQDYALIMARQHIPGELIAPCNAHGFVHAARYAIHADEEGQPVHLGDAHSSEQANAVIRRLTFETGTYSRCWEISFIHLDGAALDYLKKAADTLSSPYLHVFYMPHGDIGVLLIGTPWNDANLLDCFGLTALELRQAQLQDGMPRSLMDVLRLAGEAEVRVLIFEGDAPELDGLPVYDDD